MGEVIKIAFQIVIISIGDEMGRGSNLTEAEQNRLITDNIDRLVPMAAAEFRGRGIDYEELEAIAAEALTVAARSFDDTWGIFPAYAYLQIRCRIQDDIKSGRHHLLAEQPDLNEILGIEKIYEHDVWGVLGNTAAITELWPTSFDGSPEEHVIVYDEIKDKQAKFDAAFISLSPLERKLITLVFLRDPVMTITNAARETRISYLKSSRTLKRGLSKMRKVILSMETNAAQAQAA